jgi:hypothetical protein
VLLSRLTLRHVITAPLFTFAAWLFVTGAFGPSA